jgi:hypothetical protein
LEYYKYLLNKKPWSINLQIDRNETSCQCGVCKNVFENGLVVEDNFHADYLYDCEGEFTAEGFPIRYFDSKEEVNEWLKTLPNEIV